MQCCIHISTAYLRSHMAGWQSGSRQLSPPGRDSPAWRSSGSGSRSDRPREKRHQSSVPRHQSISSTTVINYSYGVHTLFVVSLPCCRFSWYLGTLLKLANVVLIPEDSGGEKRNFLSYQLFMALQYLVEAGKRCPDTRVLWRREEELFIISAVYGSTLLKLANVVLIPEYSGGEKRNLYSQLPDITV